MKKATFCKTICAIILMLGTSIVSIAQDEVPNDMSGFRDDNGKTFLFYVTGDDSQECYGGKDNIYTDDSPLSVAAVHAGLLKVKETKLIKVKVLSPATGFPSITRNGITSESSDSSDGSYQLLAPEKGDIANAPSTMSQFMGKNGVVFTFRVKAHKEGPIWGGGRDSVYTSDSEIATAAIHAGVLKAGETGIVKLMMLPGRKSYPAVTRNGLTSHSFDSWDASYKFLKREESDN
jgi:hypothetical protein